MTNAGLGGVNTGPKVNLKTLPGLDALTGKGNFDIAENIILHFVNLIRGFRSTHLALLVKWTVVRNLLLFLDQVTNAGDFQYYRVDAMRWFGAAVDAGLLTFKVGADVVTRHSCTVFDAIGGQQVGEVGVVDDRLVYDTASYQRTAFLERRSPPVYIWRQGIKHDLRDRFELIPSVNGLHNRHGENVDIEPEVLYPLYKGSDLFNGRAARFVVPLYQRDLQDQLQNLPQRSPKLWAYLEEHADEFRQRRSRIYCGRPQFAIFGIGAYTYRQYKIAIASFYSEPVFRLLEPSPLPAVTDDTCYLLATDDYAEAVFLLAMLTLPVAKEFLLAISSPGSKRRFSKEVLSRLTIPPFSACPQSLRSLIVDSWRVDRAFSASLQSELTTWLETYSPAVTQDRLFSA